MGVWSSDWIMVNPVLVHPDIASNTLLVYDIPMPKTKGSAPTRAIRNHATATATSVIETGGSKSRTGTLVKRYPTTRNATGALAMGSSRFHSWKITRTRKGTSDTNPRNRQIRPTSCTIIAR